MQSLSLFNLKTTSLTIYLNFITEYKLIKIPDIVINAQNSVCMIAYQ